MVEQSSTRLRDTRAFSPTQVEEFSNPPKPNFAILLSSNTTFETYAIDMRQTINDIVKYILRGRTELHRLATVLGPINILTSLFLLGVTTVLILTVFRKSFKSTANAARSDIEPQRLGENGPGTSSNRMKKNRPFGGM